MNKKPAFTLIELLVLFAILAIFSAIAAPKFINYRRKIRLQSSVEIMKTSLYKNFSSARSQPSIFGVSGISGGNSLETFKCDFPNCTTKTNIKNENLRSNVLLDSDFEIKFLPPHGDANFIGGDTLSVFLNYDGEQKEIKIYKSSGLITNEN